MSIGTEEPIGVDLEMGTDENDSGVVDVSPSEGAETVSLNSDGAKANVVDRMKKGKNGDKAG